MRDVDGTPTPAQPDRRLLLATVALVAACALVAVLGWQNRALRASQHELEERAEQPYVGMFVPTVTARSVDGATLTLGAPARGMQILYFFMPSCQFCQASVPAVRALARRVPGTDLVGVGTGPIDELREHVRTTGFAFPVVELPDDRARMLYRSRDVPMVMVIDGDGRVRYRHVGALTGEHVEEIVAAAAIPAAQRELSFQPGVVR